MNVEISIPEVVEIFKEIQEQPKQIFEMIRVEIRENVGQYLSKLMAMELAHFLGRERYEQGQGEVNHRNGSYDRRFALTSSDRVRCLMDEVFGDENFISQVSFKKTVYQETIYLANVFDIIFS